MRDKQKFSMWFVTLMAVATIAFGASEALAANAASTCMISPPTELGECVTQEGSCHARCIAQPEAGEGSFGECSGSENCCGCFL